MKLTVFIFAMSLISVHGTPLHAQSTKPVKPADCITVRYLLSDHSYRSPVQVSPVGNRVAYLVRIPNLETNNNDVSLYVEKLGDGHSTVRKPLLTGSALSQAHWLRDGKRLAVLMKDAGRVVVTLINVETGVHEVIARSKSDIVEYSIAANGEHLAFVIDKPFAEVSNAVSESEAARGYSLAGW